MVMYLMMIDTPADQSKFENIYFAYRGLMYHVAYSILNNEDDAEDAVHSAFVKIAENIMKIGEAVCPKTKAYVVTIVESTAIDLYRRKQRHPEVSYSEETVGLQVEYSRSHVIARCFSQLPKRYRHILLLKYRYGYDNREVAKLLDITETNAIKVIQRAKRKLDSLCKEEGIR